VDEHGIAKTVSTMVLIDIDVFDVDSRPADKGRKVLKKDGQTHGDLLIFGQDDLGYSFFSKQILPEEFLGRSHLVGEPIVRALVEGVREVTWKKPETGAKAGCTDGSHLFHMGRIPTVLFGPGDVLIGHQADEWVTIENIITSTEVLISVFNRLLARQLNRPGGNTSKAL
jgi:hypothetical protein